MKRVPIAAMVLTLLAWCATGWSSALAAQCGGNRECRCGDRVVRDYQLRADLGPCQGNGLEIGAAIELDGGGHRLIGSQGKGFGLRLTAAASGSRVRNLKVSGFNRGIRLQDVRGVRVEDVETYRNGDPREHEGYGIDLAKGATDNLLSRVRVHDNADEGIHFGARGRGNRLVDSEISRNYRENVYVLASEGTRIERSRLRSPGQGAANVYVKFARDTRIEGNQIDGGTIQIRGASSGTVLSGNTLKDAIVVLQDQEDRRFGKGRPTRTTIRGGRIDVSGGVSGSCIRVESASDLVVEDVDVRCRDAVAVGGSGEITLNGLANTQVRCAGKGRVTRLQGVDVRFVDAAGKPSPRVKLRSRSGAVLGEAGGDGRYRGAVEVGRLECPGGEWRSIREVEVDAGGTPRTVAIAALRGNVTVSRAPAANR
jgi:hypothetical protein